MYKWHELSWNNSLFLSRKSHQGFIHLVVLRFINLPAKKIQFFCFVVITYNCHITEWPFFRLQQNLIKPKLFSYFQQKARTSSTGCIPVTVIGVNYLILFFNLSQFENFNQRQMHILNAISCFKPITYSCILLISYWL